MLFIVRFVHIMFHRDHYAYTVSHVIGEVVITGHDPPLIVGVPRDITCTWNGETNATKIEWFLAGLHTFPIESADNSNSVVLSSHPNTKKLDGAMFTCRVTLDDETHEETITLEVKGFHSLMA